MDEDHTEKALTLLSSWVAGETEIVLPSLWVYEVGNIVGRKSGERAEEIMALLLDYRFPEARTDAGHLMATLDLMRRHGVTFYDASYHAVALKAGGTFVTADDAYVRRAGNAGHVVSLKDLVFPFASALRQLEVDPPSKNN
ncbi:MAG: type II toxin-antitoxin system VapC family toxin [Desulfuromonadales bacterium]|nr:type II toxin-antitoxin system VapC family toxin [Desulfuromonadales bacterium]